jgi:hypothetical protein
MKRLFASLLFSFCAVSVSLGTIHTLSNMPYSPGMYTTFADALAAAINDDTIYVHGSNINYGDIDVTKSIVIIGTGHHPDKQNALVSSFQYITVSIESVQLIGLTFNYFSSGYNNGTIRKCRIRGGNQGYIGGVMLFGVGNWLIEGNIFDLPQFDRGIHFGGASPNTIVRNNIFSTSNNMIMSLTNSPVQKTYILNNVFIGNNNNYAFQSVTGAVMDNNIFIASSPDGGSLISCEMNNNISYACTDNSFGQPGLDNLAGVDPQFLSYTVLASFSYNHDFRLANTSPGHNTGLDGTDRGVFGNIGFKFTMTGEPAIASITAFTITSPTTIPANGTLNISITSKRVH